MEVNRFGEDNKRTSRRAERGPVVPGMEQTSTMPSVSMGLVFRVRPEQAEDNTGEMGVLSLPGTDTVRDGEYERTLWYFRRDDVDGTLEIPREHGLSQQAQRIQVLRSTLYGIGQIIDDAERHHSFGPREAKEIRDQIENALSENEPWTETIDVPEWANRPLPKSWGVKE